MLHGSDPNVGAAAMKVEESSMCQFSHNPDVANIANGGNVGCDRSDLKVGPRSGKGRCVDVEFSCFPKADFSCGTEIR